MRRNCPQLSTQKRSWTRLALAATLAVGPLLVGCDNSTGRADKAILEGVSSIKPATTPEEGLKNITTLDALSKQADASTGRKAIAKAALAGAELQTAQQYVKDLQQQELLAARKIWEMEQVVGQIQNSKVLIDAANRRDPALALTAPVLGQTIITEDLKNKAASAREGDVWVKSDTVPMGTVSSVKQQISTLNGKISDIKNNIDTLTKQRDQALVDAGKAQQDSEAAKGDDSQKAYIKAADLRKQAALIGVQIEAAQASLVPLNADLAAAQAHETIVTAAAASFDTAGQTYTENYAKIKAQAEKIAATAKDMLGGDDKFSLKTKAKELTDLMAAADETRAKAVEQYKAAISHYKDAVAESEKVKSEAKKEVPAGSPDAELIKSLNDAHEASSLRLGEAEADAGLAAVQSAYALLLSRKAIVIQSATSAATPLALTVPAELTDAKNADQLKEARTAADEAYKSADDALDNVSTGASASPKTRTAAKIARAVVNAGWSQLAASSGDTENAKTRMANAQGYQKEASEDPNGIVIPPYLMALTDTVPAATATATPATKPAAATSPVDTPANP